MFNFKLLVDEPKRCLALAARLEWRDECLIYTGYIKEKQRPYVMWRGKYVSVHVKVAELMGVQIPKRTRQSCNNRLCVRPGHQVPAQFGNGESKPLTKEQRKHIIECAQRGLPQEHIAFAMGIRISAVRYTIKKAGLVYERDAKGIYKLSLPKTTQQGEPEGS